MIINDLDGYYIVFDTKNWNTELDTLAINLTGSLWDFSNIKYLGQEKEVCFIGDMEGHVKLIGQDEILDFCQSNDYLRLSQIQTPLVKVRKLLGYR